MSHFESTYNNASDNTSSAALTTDLNDIDDDTWLYGNDGVDISTNPKPVPLVPDSATDTSTPVTTANKPDDYGQPDERFHDENNNTVESKIPESEATNDGGDGQAVEVNASSGNMEDCGEESKSDAVLSKNDLEDSQAPEVGVIEYQPENFLLDENSQAVLPNESQNGENRKETAEANENGTGDEDDEDDEDDDDDDGFKVNIVLDKPLTNNSNDSDAQDKQLQKTASSNGLPTNGAAKAQVKGIDLDAPGLINDVPTDEYNLVEIPDEEKPWRKPGADITDYFNYGFNEETWIAYCIKKRRQRIESSNLMVKLI